MLFVCICDVIRFGTIKVAWYNWIYPTTYWFINAIFIFFVVIYILQGFLKIKKINNNSQIGRGNFALFLYWLLLCMSFIIFVL